MTKTKKRNRVISWLLTLAMIVGEMQLPQLAMTAQAGGDIVKNGGEPVAENTDDVIYIREYAPKGETIYDLNNALTQEQIAALGGEDSIIFNISGYDLPYFEGKFSVTQGELRVDTDDSFDYETLYPGSLSCNITFTASSDSNSASYSLTKKIEVTDRNEKPELNNITFTASEALAEGGIIGTVTATDPDIYAPEDSQFNKLSYTISEYDISEYGDNPFEIDIDTGVLRLKNDKTLDYEGCKKYIFTVYVYDRRDSYEHEFLTYDPGWNDPYPFDPALGTYATITINVLDVNEPPYFVDADETCLTVTENAHKGETVGTIEADDQDNNKSIRYDITGGTVGKIFKIDPATGVLKIDVDQSSTCDYEYWKSCGYDYNVEITVSDKNDATLSSTHVFSVSINDINEAPKFSYSEYFINVGECSHIFDKTVSANDPDNAYDGRHPKGYNVLVYSVMSYVSGDENPFEVNSNTAELSLKAGETLDYEKRSQYQIILKATDCPTDGSVHLSAATLLTINVVNEEEAPYFVDPDKINLAVDENSTGARAGKIVIADPDNPQALEDNVLEIIGGSAKDLFEIRSGGYVYMKQGTEPFNYEAVKKNGTVYDIDVRVKDKNDATLSADHVFTISINDVNEAPYFDLPDNDDKEIWLDVNKKYADRTVSCSDPDIYDDGPFIDNEVIIPGDNANIFAISDDGVLYIKDGVQLDPEVKDSYDITLRVRDKDRDNYADLYQDMVFTVKLKHEAKVITKPVARSLSYNGETHKLVSAGSVSGGDLLYSLSENGTYTADIPEGKNAGSYTVYYKSAADAIHYDSAVSSVVVNIARAEAKVSANDVTKAYGSEDPELTVSVNGTFGSDSLTYSISRESGEALGTYTITPSGAAVQGNYNVSYETGTLTINTALITPAVTLSQNSFVYDGTEKRPAVTVKNGDNEIAASHYSVRYTDNINAGTAKVTVSTNNTGYSFDEVKLNFTIEKAPITPVVAMPGWSQGAAASIPVVTGNPGNGVVAFYYKVKDAADSTYSQEKPVLEGSYTIKAVISETVNYLGGSDTADFSITKEPAAVTEVPVANSLIYNGSEQVLVSAGAARDGVMKYAKGSSEGPSESFNEALPAGTNGGVYYVWYKACGDVNHKDSAMGSVMVVIGRAGREAPEAPVKQSSTASSITLVAHYGYEYCIKGHAWQSSNTFSGLNADTEYTFCQRISGDSNYENSPASAAASFKTDALPTEDKPTPTPSENATPTPTGEATPTPSENVTPTPTVEPTPTEGPVPTYSPTPTPVPVIEEPATMRFVFEDGTDAFSAEYTGCEITPVIKGYCGSKPLRKGVDYSISYSKNINAGKAEITVKGKNGYSGTYKLSFTIEPKQIADESGEPAEGIIISGLVVKSDEKVAPVLVYNGVELNKKDYHAKVSNDVNGAEMVEIIADGGNLCGAIKSRPVLRMVDKKAYEKTAIKVTLNKAEYVYDGTPILLGDELKVTDSEEKILEEGADYVVSYPADVINAGKKNVQIIGIGSYTGRVSKSYTIAPAKNAVMTVSLVPEEGMPEGCYSYTKNGVTPAVFITADLNGTIKVLSEGSDYTLKYSNNKKAGVTGNIRISYTGNYKGASAQDVSFTIEKVSLDTAEIFVGDMLYKKAGKYRAKPVVTINGEVVASSEYTLQYSVSGQEMPQKLKLEEGENEKIVTVTVTSKGNSFADGTEELSATYKVYRSSKTNISKAKISLVVKDGTKQLKKTGYTGNPITFDPKNEYRQGDIKVKIGKTVLTGAQVFENFNVSYADNVKTGKKATIIITAKEDSPFSGMASGKFKIVKRKVK